MNSQDKFSFLYGRVEVKGKASKGRALHSVYYMLHEGYSGWQRGNSKFIWTPEIDIIELFRTGPDPAGLDG